MVDIDDLSIFKKFWNQKLLKERKVIIDSYLNVIYGDPVVSKAMDFGDDFIKKLLEKKTYNFWIDALNHGCMY